MEVGEFLKATLSVGPEVQIVSWLWRQSSLDVCSGLKSVLFCGCPGHVSRLGVSRSELEIQLPGPLLNQTVVLGLCDPF